jgi:hypothetical protein
MLAIYCLRQTSRRLVINTSRSTFATLPHPKSSEVQTGTNGNSNNRPGFYNTAKEVDGLEPVSSNDILEAKRIEKEQKNDKKSTPVVTSTEKFSSGLSPLQATSSIIPTGDGLFHDAKVSNTPVSPGIPITANAPPPQTTNEEPPNKEKQIPSSYFSAFLRGINSGLPFFPSRKTISSPVNIATTREYYIPVCN